MSVRPKRSEAYRNKPKQYPPEIKAQAIELFNKLQK